MILFGYDELQSPMAVKTHAPRPSDEFHTYPCISTVTYAVDSDRFSNRHFPLHYSDCGQTVSRAALGLPGVPEGGISSFRHLDGSVLPESHRSQGSSGTGASSHRGARTPRAGE